MKKIWLVIVLCSALPLSGCFLDNLFVRNHYVHSKMPYIAGYRLPAGKEPAEFWGEKNKFFRQLTVEEEGLSNREVEMVNHLYDYKDLMDQLEASVKEYNALAKERNTANGYEQPNKK
jgi:hypothetical protein